MPELCSRRFLLKQSSKALLGLSAIQAYNLIKPSLSQGQNQDNLSMEATVANLKNQIPQWLNQYKIPGLALAIIHDQQIFWHGSFGVKKYNSQQSINQNTIFAAASLSKPLFAYGVMKLVEKGKLNLDTPLTEYTTKPYITDPRIRLVTARQVLAHMTGFPNWSGSLPVWFKTNPGKRFGYSGEGFLYLQHVIEEITRQPFAKYISEQLLLPLGMNSSSYIWQPNYQYLAVDGHNRLFQSTPMRQPKVGSAAGSLRTTAQDYAHFMVAMMQSGTIDSYLLTESSVEEMLRSQIQLNYHLDWGLGWGLEYSDKQKYFWHWGDAVIYKTFAIASRELGTGVVILTNSQNGFKICPDITTAVMSGKRYALDFEQIEY